MRSQSTLLLIIAAAFAFAPLIDRWLYDDSHTWYRHHILFFLAIVLTFALLRRRHHDDI
ncbi:MAG: hypothetical protein ACSHWQ_04405 [Spongiibacteraceae bacterium]